MADQFETRHHSSPPMVRLALSRPPGHKMAMELRARLPDQSRAEFLKLNAGVHDIRGPLTYMKGYVGVVDNDLIAKNGQTLESLDPDFKYDNFDTKIMLASASVTREGTLRFSHDDISGIKDALSKTSLIQVARQYQVPDAIIHQIKIAPISQEKEHPKLFAHYRQLVFQDVLERKVAKLGDPELMMYVQNKHLKHPANIRAYFDRVFELLKRDFVHLQKNTADNISSKVSLDKLTKSHLDSMVLAAEEMSNLLDSSFQFLNIDQIDFTKDRSPVTITTFINKAIKLHENKINSRSITCDVVRNDVVNDELVLHPESWRVLDNIFSNALKYTNTHIRFVIENMGDHLFVVVIDNGRGLGSENKKRLFELGEQGAEAIESNGIGLWVAQHIVLEHGGFMGVDGEDFRGAAFYFVLPKSSNQTVPDTLRQDADNRAKELRNQFVDSIMIPATKMRASVAIKV